MIWFCLVFFIAIFAAHILNCIWMEKSTTREINEYLDVISDAYRIPRWMFDGQTPPPPMGQDVEVTYTASNGEVIKHHLESLVFKAPPDSGNAQRLK